MSEHTPTARPWEMSKYKTDKINGGEYIELSAVINEWGGSAWIGDIRDKKDAHHIVKCVNNFDKLVEVLEKITRANSFMDRGTGMYLHKPNVIAANDMIEIAQEALKNIEQDGETNG